jgi:hypothetical protein
MGLEKEDEIKTVSADMKFCCAVNGYIRPYNIES